MANLSAIKLPNGTTYSLKDSGALQLTGGQVTGPVSFGDSVSMDEVTTGDLVVNGGASFTNNIQANTINGVEVGTNPKFTDTNTVTTVSTSGSGNAVTSITASNGALTVTKGTTFLTSHQDISGKADKATTLAGYGITDAKIASGVITLGSNTITPLTSSSTLSAAKLSGAIPSAVTATTQASTDNSTKIATTAYVTTAIANLPEPMVFKGSVGTGGTVTSLPTAAASNEGWTYKVITTLSSPAAKVGDTVISNGSSWVVIPSGDEPSGTVTSVAVSNGGGLSVSGSPVTSSGTITISHADTSSQASSSNSGRTYIQSLTLDTYGHVTGISTATETITDTNTHRPIQMNGTEILGNNTTALNLKAGSNVSLSNSSGTVTIAATDTTYESKAAASGGTAVSLVTTGEKYTWNSKTSNTGTITSVKTTAGTHTAINVSSGAVSFNVPTKTSHLTNDSGFLTSHQTLYEANLNWGGKNFSASYGPIDAAMIGQLGANRFAFLKAAGLTIEYSTNGGSSWTDYGATDTQKTGLFGYGQSFYLGKHTAAGSSTLNDQLRVTIATSAAGLYTVLNKIAIYMSTSGNTVQVKIERALEDTPTTYATHLDWTGISGWSGWNILNIAGLTTYGNSPAYQYGRVRFTFKQTAVTTTYSAASISQIMGFGGVGWGVPSNMARDGHLYKYDNDQNATFPAKVTATSFSGDLTGNVTGNVSGSAGSVAWSGVTGKPTATGSKVTGITASTTATKTTLGTAFTIPNVTSAGSASTWAFEEVSIPNVTSAGSASTWAFEDIACDDITSWSAGSGSASISGAVDSSDSTQLNITISHTHTAPSLSYTARTVSSKKSGANGSAPTLGTAIKVQSKKSGANGSAPTLGTAFTVPNVTGNTSATVSITDPGHTHSI